jgi:RNA polymerase sigma factor (sigma-70 family)
VTSYRPEFAQMTDEVLVGQCRAGGREKEAAFTELVVRYQKRIYLAARKMMHGDHDEADEIAQETFVKAYQALDSFRGDSQLYTWLYRIMMNTVIQRSRRSKVREMVGMDAIETHASNEITPDQRLISNETTRLLEEAIETLPPKQQRVFMMRFYEELPYEEIAGIVGTSVGGLKANYFHAVRKIGEYLKASGQIAAEFVAQTASD